MKEFIKEATQRIKTETPVFFKKIIKGGIGIGAVGAGLVAPALSAAVHWPEILVQIGGHMVAIGGVAAAVSKFACADKKEDDAA